jgi:hypothetical protein
MELLRHGIPMGDAERLAEALSSYSGAYGRFDAVAREILPGWDYSPPAVLTHTVTVLRERTSDIGRNFIKQAQLQEAAERMDLEIRMRYDDRDVSLVVRGPKDRLEELARYADEELERTVDVEEEEDPYHGEDDAPGVG